MPSVRCVVFDVDDTLYLERDYVRSGFHAVAQWMAPVVLTGTLGEGRSKPHPTAFQLVEEALGCGADECVYVADNPKKDFGGPRSLGWRTVRVRRHGGLHEAIENNATIDVEIADLTQLGAVIDLV